MTAPPGRARSRIRELTELAGRESQAERRAGEAAGALTNLQRTGELLLQRLGQQREQLEGPAPVVVARATALLPETGFQLPAPALEADADAATVLTFGRARVTVVCDLASALEASAASLADAEQKLLQQAHAVVGDLDGVEPAVSLAALVDSLGAARLQVTAEHVKAAQRAEMLVTRLAEREKLEREVDEQRGHAATYSDLAYDLRQDKLVAFLQDQALQILAAAGTRHLQALSGERYELRFTKHAFSVVDRWNADEERNVRTLSGGETFLASLALALALSEQVRSLSVTERARLDSLFLDEGFGTLDSESLRTVQDALDHLSGDGRLVGVITHVRELAENLPRIEVEKSPRGSRLKPIAQ